MNEKEVVSHQAELYKRICERHLQDSAFLYYLWYLDRNRPQTPWQGQKDREDRLIPHLDALTHGRMKALDLVYSAADLSKPNDLYIAARLLCRHDLKEETLILSDKINFQDKKMSSAFSDALKADMPDAWGQSLLLPLAASRAEAIPMAADIAGHRRIDIAEALLDYAKPLDFDHQDLILLIRGLGRMASGKARMFLLDHLADDHEEILFETSLALLRIRTEQLKLFRVCLNAVGKYQLPSLILAFCGDEAVLGELLAALRKNSKQPKLLLSLGLMGHIQAIEPLIHCLDQPDPLEEAAIALNLITGAGLMEAICDPDSPESGKSLNRNPEPSHQESSKGNQKTITRLSRSPVHWKNWWAMHGRKFVPDRRYRNGRLYSPERLTEAMLSPSTSKFLRVMAYEELVVRFNVDTRFETDLFVDEQVSAIGRFNNFFKAKPNRWPTGRWLLGGKSISLKERLRYR